MKVRWLGTNSYTNGHQSLERIFLTIYQTNFKFLELIRINLLSDNGGLPLLLWKIVALVFKETMRCQFWRECLSRGEILGLLFTLFIFGREIELSVEFYLLSNSGYLVFGECQWTFVRSLHQRFFTNQDMPFRCSCIGLCRCLSNITYSLR